MLSKMIVLCCLVYACHQTGKKKNQDASPDLYQSWVHAHEEDEAERHYKTFRPVSYPFPPSRGRDGFEIKEKGVLILRPVAAMDGNSRIEGKWELKGNELRLIGPETISRYEIISLSKEKLVLKALPGK